MTADNFTTALACLDAFLAAFPAASRDPWLLTFQLFCKSERDVRQADEAVDAESRAALARLDEGAES